MFSNFLSLLTPAAAYAQDQIVLNPEGQWSKLGTLTAPTIVSTAISLVMLVVALLFFFMLVWGGLRWVMSQGEEKNVKAARDQITSALVGLAIVFAAWAIMQLISTVFGVDIFKLKIPEM
jgi:TRAP-type C4-dicarboxylate transport system permease small subunit